ncbi:glycosyltransferase family 4 protein [Pontibacterium granulatum]|uniref:glycosyltransferase family 4 protein n=1 Tax=Pontibacterium granulatum TaxID=2036029 RepID=UPI00249C025E|nr:glycosyltransferase family 4 protein [Pontibacterium granulatum]MDI3325965.1 glycosyltransferase family 4 protein [Pontibacterium granulatum]
MKDIQLIVGPFPPPLGGVSASADNLKRLMSECGYSCACFSTSAGSHRENLYARKGLSSYFFALRLMVRLVLFLCARRNIRVVHLFVVSNSAFFRDFILLLVLWFFRKRVIVHLHSKIRGELFLSERLLPIMMFALRLADKILVLSDGHKDFFSKFVSAEKIRVLENFVFSEDFKRSEVERADEWLYVGRLSEKKGFVDLLEAVDQCVNEKGDDELVVRCLGLAESDEKQEFFEDRIRLLGLEKNIKLYGVVQGEGKLKHFSECKGMVFPSHFENSPVVLKEAIAADMPVIASDIEANIKILERSGNAVYFSAQSVEGLVRAFTEVSKDEGRLATLRENSRESNKFDEKYAAGVIEEVVSGFGG